MAAAAQVPWCTFSCTRLGLTSPHFGKKSQWNWIPPYPGPSGCSMILHVRSMSLQPFLGAPCLERYSEDAEPIWLAIDNLFHLQMHSLIEFCHVPED